MDEIKEAVFARLMEYRGLGAAYKRDEKEVEEISMPGKAGILDKARSAITSNIPSLIDDEEVEEAYEPGHAVADMPQYNDEYDEEGAYDTDAERLESGMAEKEAMEDLADKFNVQVTFAKTIDNKDIAIVTHENGEAMGYMDEEEMYQDLASRHEMNEEAIAALKNV